MRFTFAVLCTAVSGLALLAAGEQTTVTRSDGTPVPAATSAVEPAQRPRIPPERTWPQWRGLHGAGLAVGTNFPLEWSPTEHIAWKTEIPGRGHSSPVVWGDRIFITTAIQGEHIPGRTAPDHLGFDFKPGYLHPDSVGVDYAHTMKVLALDAKTGKILWEREVFSGPVHDNRHRSNTYASPTVVTDGTMLYASFESEGFFAFDVDGNLKWKKSFGGMAKAGLGPGTSPILFERFVILQADLEMGAGSSIVGLDRQTGEEIWRTPRSNRRSWATPILVDADGRTELIASGAEAVVAYDPRNGQELWRTDGTRSHPIPSFVAGHGLVFATAGSQAKVAMGIRPGPNGEVDGSRIAWRYNKGTAYVASPILLGDYLYMISDGGIMTCLDAKTGTLVYEGGRVPVPATFRASPVAFGDKILLTSEEGETFVIKAGPKHEVLGRNTIDEPVWASPALVDGTIYLRGASHLYAIR